MKYDYLISGKSKEDLRAELPFLFSNYIMDLTREQRPQYLNDMPFLRGKIAETAIFEDLIVFTVRYAPYLTISSIGELTDPDVIEHAKEILKQDEFPSYEMLEKSFGDSISENDFVFVTPVRDGKISWEHMAQTIVDWLNAKVMPVIERNNRLRVLDAIPTSPQYDVEKLLNNIFVLEDEDSDDMDDLGSQGTCFYLKDVGFVTCHHVLTPHLKCFHARHWNKKFPVEVIAQNEDIDLAILKIDGLIEEYNLTGLECGSADSMQIMDHIAVSGFPNYRRSDTGIVSPGLVVGYRPTHGIRRLLVNASIISGNSGGPVIDSDNKVIGVAVTGADCSEHSDMTENHGVIPIDALSYLKADIDVI